MNWKGCSKQQSQTEDIILEFAWSNVQKYRKCHTILVDVPVAIGTQHFLTTSQKHYHFGQLPHSCKVSLRSKNNHFALTKLPNAIASNMKSSGGNLNSNHLQITSFT